MRSDELNKAADLYVMDWAATQSPAVVLGEPLEDLERQAAVDWDLESLRELATAKLGATIDEISYGRDCAADLLFESSRDQPFHFIDAARESCGRLVFVKVIDTAPADVNSTADSEGRLSAVQMIDSRK